MVLHQRVLDAVAVPIAQSVPDEAEIALVVQMRAGTLLHPSRVREVEPVVAFCLWASPPVNLLSPKHTSTLLALARCSRAPVLVVDICAVPVEDRSEVDPDNDPVDGGRGRGLGAEHCEYGRVLPRLGDETKNADRGWVELVRFPGEALVNGVEQGVCVSLGLEVLHSNNDTTVIAHIVIVVAFEYLENNE